MFWIKEKIYLKIDEKCEEIHDCFLKIKEQLWIFIFREMVILRNEYKCIIESALINTSR